MLHVQLTLQLLNQIINFIDIKELIYEHVSNVNSCGARYRRSYSVTRITIKFEFCDQRIEIRFSV